MKLLLIYPPFGTPGIVPYSISYLKSFVTDNIDTAKNEVKCIDLNAKFHRFKFIKYYFKIKTVQNDGDYSTVLSDFYKDSTKVYSDNNKLIRTNLSLSKVDLGAEIGVADERDDGDNGKNCEVEANSKSPEFFEQLLDLILKEKPDLVAFSIVYSSQCFYATALINKLNQLNIPCIVGGPSVNQNLKKIAPYLSNEVELLKLVKKINLAELNLTKIGLDEQGVDADRGGGDTAANDSCDCNNLNCETVSDYSDYDSKDYLSKHLIIPLKTCSTCYYRQCAFCTHYKDECYFEFKLDRIKKTIEKSKQKYFFFIDDMISPSRLIELAEMLTPLNVFWSCQLKPTKELIPILPKLYESGLRCVCWGIESGNQRILNLMKKGITTEIAEQVLLESKKVKIKNVVFIMFGFPTETESEFKDTISFLEKNSNNIDLISTSLFGLQQGSKVYNDPKEFSIGKIIETPRTLLDDKISFEINPEVVKNSDCMTSQRAKEMKDNYRKSINNLNKLPKIFNFFKEQIMFFD
ncbi:radical SAM protein [Candidatus Woesearchaeota archaeon]|jgi:anaerobic magnesium-protoporphyrin IX monomethyl ester cyclase|nr:radical SAM protein [Candidatus Woesearchaeota archaeon]